MRPPSDGIDRRAFLGYAALLAAAAADPPRIFSSLGRRPVRAAAASVAGPFELEEATVASLQADMQAGRLTVRDLVERYLERIEKLDRRGPALHSIIETNPEALQLAEQLDRE